ncbi:hypothetical protein FQN51_002607, partial [Onygenales sp. PD_10]
MASVQSQGQTTGTLGGKLIVLRGDAIHELELQIFILPHHTIAFKPVNIGVGLHSPSNFDAVSHHGKSQPFSKDITKVAAIADKLLSLITPWILFVFDLLHALNLFVKAFTAHTLA